MKDPLGRLFPGLPRGRASSSTGCSRSRARSSSCSRSRRGSSTRTASRRRRWSRRCTARSRARLRDALQRPRAREPVHLPLPRPEARRDHRLQDAARGGDPLRRRRHLREAADRAARRHGERARRLRLHQRARLDEPYIKPDRRDNEPPRTWPKVAPDHYFFMGDNRRQSCDSRSWGTVPRQNLIGEVFFVYWPPNRHWFPLRPAPLRSAFRLAGCARRARRLLTAGLEGPRPRRSGAAARPAPPPAARRRVFANLPPRSSPFQHLGHPSMSNIIESIERAQLRKVPRFKAGDTVRVHFQVIEGQRRRVQVYEGIVIKRQGSGARETFTVRKQSFGVGVERTFPLHSPKIEKIEVQAVGDVNRAKLYYLRGRVGKKARVREKRYGHGSAADLAAQEAAADAAEAQEAEAAARPSPRKSRPTRPRPSRPRRPRPLRPRPPRRRPSRPRLRRASPSRPPLPQPNSCRLTPSLGSAADEADRAEAPEVRPQARCALRRRHRRGRSRLARGPARRRGRAARLRVPEGAQGAAADVSERLEAVHGGAARGALPRGARLRRAGRGARDPAGRHRPQRAAPLEPRRPARDAARA